MKDKPSKYDRFSRCQRRVTISTFSALQKVCPGIKKLTKDALAIFEAALGVKSQAEILEKKYDKLKNVTEVCVKIDAYYGFLR